MRRVFVGLAQVFVGLAAQLRNNGLLRKFRVLITEGRKKKRLESASLGFFTYLLGLRLKLECDQRVRGAALPLAR